jgi:anaerobic selenocysteine-containing dehydrogenase
MLPESRVTVRALRSREFVVVVDAFLTDTAREAHLVLPTTTLLEADDLVGSYGHHWIGVARPVAPPPSGVKSDLEIIQGVAQRVGLGEVMAGTAREWKERLISKESRARGVTLEALERAPLRNPNPSKVLFADRKFPTASGKVNLLKDEPRAAASMSDYPLSLLALSTPDAQSSQWADKPDGPAWLSVHPDVSQGVPDGAICTIESAIGSMTVRLRHDPKQRRDVALTAKGGHLEDGCCANALIRARITDLGEGGALYEERIRIVASR